MGLKPLLAGLAALALSACASADYAYCYDPWRGPVGYYTGPLDAKPACAAQPAPGGVFVAREGGWRGPYLSGPHPTPVTEAALDAAGREAPR